MRNIQVVTQPVLEQGIATAGAIEARSFLFDPKSPTLGALVGEAPYKPTHVYLAGDHFPMTDEHIAPMVHDAVDRLRTAGAQVDLCKTPFTHLKAIALHEGTTPDGKRGAGRVDVIVSERNFPGDGDEVLLKLGNKDDKKVMLAALRGNPGENEHLKTTKLESLRLMATAITENPDDHIMIASESFSKSPVSEAAHQALAAGKQVDINVVHAFVKDRGLAELTALHDEGAHITLNESFGGIKGVIPAGKPDPKEDNNLAAVGSANGTSSRDSQLDWAALIGDAHAIEALQHVWERQQAHSIPFDPDTYKPFENHEDQAKSVAA